MKVLVGLVTLCFLTVSCDAPVRTRVPTAPNGLDSNQTFNTGTQNWDNNQDNQSNNNNNNNNNTGNTNTGQSEPGYDNCDLSMQYSGGSIGYFGMCQHDTDERRFKAVFAQSNSAGTCFIPVHIQNSGNSYKLGLAQCVHNQANNAYYMTLNKEMLPPTFSYPRPEQINGVMVIAANSVNAYMGCMNAKEDYMIATNGCCYQQVPYQGRMHCLQTNPQCENAANTYANNVCNSFVQNHSNNYRQVSF